MAIKHFEKKHRKHRNHHFIPVFLFLFVLLFVSGSFGVHFYKISCFFIQ